MLKYIRLKVGCILIYLSAQLKIIVFYIHSCVICEERKIK